MGGGRFLAGPREGDPVPADLLRGLRPKVRRDHTQNPRLFGGRAEASHAPVFSHGHYDNYFSFSEVVEIKRLIKSIATPATWKAVKHYFEGVPNEIKQVK